MTNYENIACKLLSHLLGGVRRISLHIYQW